jgi:hypothetical protein
MGFVAPGFRKAKMSARLKESVMVFRGRHRRDFAKGVAVLWLGRSKDF